MFVDIGNAGPKLTLGPDTLVGHRVTCIGLNDRLNCTVAVAGFAEANMHADARRPVINRLARVCLSC
jgi:hypothetical protein